VKHDASHESQSILASRDDEDYVDLQPLLAQMWKARKFILIGTVSIVVIAFLTNEFLGKYWSEGHVRINNISPASYSVFQPVFSDVSRFKAYVVKEGVNDRESAMFIEGLLSLPFEKLERYVSIAKSMNLKGGKSNAVVKGKDNESESEPVFMGMDLKFPGPSPAAAQLRGRLFLEYFADSFIYADLLKWLDSIGSDREAAAYSAKLDAMKILRRIDEENIRLVALRSLTKRFPEALRMGPSPWISVEVKNEIPGALKSGVDGDVQRRLQVEGLERFLPPAAQIIATEIAIMDGEIDLLKLQRKQNQSDLVQKFYDQAVAIGARTSSGREYLKELIVLKDVFSRDILTSDAVGMEVVNGISYELEQRQFRYAAGFKFLSGPSLPEGRNKKSPLLIVLGAGVGGMFFMVVLALVMSWWRRNAGVLTDENGLTAKPT
jgi:hypothetical protein